MSGTNVSVFVDVAEIEVSGIFASEVIGSGVFNQNATVVASSNPAASKTFPSVTCDKLEMSGSLLVQSVWPS